MSLLSRCRNLYEGVTSSVLCMQLIIAGCALILVASQPVLVRQYEMTLLNELRHGPDRIAAARNLCVCVGWQLGVSGRPSDFVLYQFSSQRMTFMLCPTSPPYAQEPQRAAAETEAVTGP